MLTRVSDYKFRIHPEEITWQDFATETSNPNNILSRAGHRTASSRRCSRRCAPAWPATEHRRRRSSREGKATRSAGGPRLWTVRNARTVASRRRRLRGEGRAAGASSAAAPRCGRCHGLIGIVAACCWVPLQRFCFSGRGDCDRRSAVHVMMPARCTVRCTIYLQTSNRSRAQSASRFSL